MNSFHTQVVVPPSPEKISYHTKCLFMGSCFADSIGKIMKRYKLPVVINPFGTLFNPVSIAQNLESLITGKVFRQNDLIYYNDLWISLSHYTGFSHPNPETCLTAINQSVAQATSWLKACKYLLLTFGTAQTYCYHETGETVANCHKLPASMFTRKLSVPSDLIQLYSILLPRLKNYNPDIHIIFTLSPVRHWADGAVNNQLSKSILHLCIHELVKTYPYTSYFPAYEIFMDELRDYRFYAADMLHPSEQGVDYVWEKFSEAFIDESSRKIMASVKTILKAINHHPLHTETTEYRKFLQNTLKKIRNLSNLYPFLDFSNEIDLLHHHGQK